MRPDPILLVGAARTPIGALNGALKTLSTTQLGAHAVRSALAGTGLDVRDVSEVLMGCVLPAGLGQAPARQAALGAGIPEGVPATMVSKVCGSGMRAIMAGHDAISAGSAEIVIAGGMESMSNAPHLLDQARQGIRLGHGRLIDHMMLDGLEDAYDRGRSMGSFAEATAGAYQLSRAAQDEYALGSLERAIAASTSGAFDDEIAPLAVRDRMVAVDEAPTRARPEKIPLLKAAFAEGGTITAANASSISDGAAAVVLMRASVCDRRGTVPLATMRGHVTRAGAPSDFATAPIPAIKAVLDRVGWTAAEVDLFEINEAFAIVPMLVMRAFDVSRDRMNVHGGACAIGHPIGASGARIVVTLLNALRSTGGRRGVAALCIGGGEATAIAVELC